MKNTTEYILKATCPAARGIVAGVSGFLAERGCYISELSHFDDRQNANLFMRTRFHIDNGDATQESNQEEFQAVADKFSMDWQIIPVSQTVRTLIMVSQYDHCLNDLLYRLRKGELNIEITAVVSNHQGLRPMVEREGIRFIQKQQSLSLHQSHSLQNQPNPPDVAKTSLVLNKKHLFLNYFM